LAFDDLDSAHLIEHLAAAAPELLASSSGGGARRGVTDP
jgi:hypothetical protein